MQRGLDTVVKQYRRKIFEEVARLGFKKCIIPKKTSEKLDIPNNLTVYYVRNLREAIEISM